MAQTTLVVVWACRVVYLLLLLVVSAGIGVGTCWCWRALWERKAVGNIVIKRLDSKKKKTD